MRITIDNYLLAGDGTDSPTPTNVPTTICDFQIEATSQTQIAQGIRRSNVLPIDRGNIRTEIRFHVYRRWPSINDAEVFVLSHGDQVPGSGLVTLTAGTLTGIRTVRYFRSSAIQVVSSKYKGVTTEHSYAMVCGQIKTKKIDLTDKVP